MQPAFWAAHMWNATKGPISNRDADKADTAFGVTEDVITDFYLRHLGNESPFPYFQIVLQSGYAVEVEYCNEPEDYEVLYLVCQKDCNSPICVGNGSGHWQLPAFRWEELLRIAQAAYKEQVNPDLAMARAILLLLPSTWFSRNDNLDVIRQELCRSWEALNLLPQPQFRTLVGELIDSNQNGVQWQNDDRFGWIKDAADSTRNPPSPARLKAEEFSRLREFLGRIDS